MSVFGSYRIPPPGIPYDWMVLRGLYRMSRPEPIMLTMGVDGYGREITSPLTVDLAPSWAERLAEETL